MIRELGGDARTFPARAYGSNAAGSAIVFVRRDSSENELMLVPLAAGMKPGMVMTAPVWGPNMPMAETRIFTVIGKEPTPVEGRQGNAGKVEERRGPGAAVLGSAKGGKGLVVAAVSKDLVGRGVTAPLLLEPAGRAIGGGGGARRGARSLRAAEARAAHFRSRAGKIPDVRLRR